MPVMRSLKRSACQDWELSHPSGFEPEDILDFIYLDEFEDDWSGIYPQDRDEHALWALEIFLTINPRAGDVVGGTGGLRKFRFASDEEPIGKSGACRVCYAYFPDHHCVLLMMAYPKSRKGNLSATEKAGVKRYLEQVKDYLDQRSLGSDNGQ